MTCTEQLLYEIHDPRRYVTPDCVLDLTDVDLFAEGPDRVGVTGARAGPRTSTYKAVIGYFDGYIGCGEVGYAGINAAARARLAAEVVKERLRIQGVPYSEILVDMVGMTSLHGDAGNRPEPYEVRLRMAGRCPGPPQRRGLWRRRAPAQHAGPRRAGGRNEPRRQASDRSQVGADTARLGAAPSGDRALTMPVRVYDLAHARSGDKGNTSNVAVIAYDEPAWQLLRRELTEERVMNAYAHLAQGPVRRYELPKLRALNFVIENALAGGVTRSLRQDAHGKSLSAVMLTIELPGESATTSG